MNKAQLLKFINPVLFLLLFLQIVNIIIMKLIPEAGFLYYIHTWNGAILSIVVLTHLFLNFGWIKATYFSKKQK